MNLPVSRIGVNKEKIDALIDTQFVIWERGNPIIIYLRKESNVDRDKFGSIKARTNQLDTLNFRAYPIKYNPTEKYLEKVGIREKVDCTITTSMQDWVDAGYDLEQLKDLDLIRMTVVIDQVKYEIKDKALTSQFEETYLYVILGLNRI